MIFAQSQSFSITANGNYKVYAVDDIGRGKVFDLEITSDKVEFGNLSGVKATTYTGDKPIADGKMTGCNVVDEVGILTALPLWLNLLMQVCF